MLPALRCALLGAALVACGGGVVHEDASTDDSEPRYGVLSAGGEGIAGPPSDRLKRHDGPIIESLVLQPIYIGTDGMDRAPVMDGELGWIITSGYWGLLRQYGVREGTVLPRIEIATSDIFPEGSIEDGAVTTELLQERVRELFHSSTVKAPTRANALAIFMPDGVNVTMGVRGTHAFRTCIDAHGFHAHDGELPYSVFPPCPAGRSLGLLSHELAEMSTDPIVGQGWFSDGDHRRGSEVADLCNDGTFAAVGRRLVSRLWSNSDAQCMPR